MGAFSNFMESMRYLFADIIGEQDDRPAFLPENLPEAVVPVASEAIHLLTEYQGTPYARVYVYRLRRFIGKPGVDDAMLCEIARLMAMRMAYEDTIRIAQQKLIELQTDPDTPRADDIRKFRLDELVDVLPAVIADPILGLLDWLGWVHKRVSIHFNNKSWLGIRRLRIEASLRRWRRYSIRYGQGAALGRALAAHDRPRADQAARCCVGSHADRNHGAGLWQRPTAMVLRTGTRSSTVLPSRPLTAC